MDPQSGPGITFAGAFLVSRVKRSTRYRASVQTDAPRTMAGNTNLRGYNSDGGRCRSGESSRIFCAGNSSRFSKLPLRPGNDKEDNDGQGNEVDHSQHNNLNLIDGFPGGVNSKLPVVDSPAGVVEPRSDIRLVHLRVYMVASGIHWRPASAFPAAQPFASLNLPAASFLLSTAFDSDGAFRQLESGEAARPQGQARGK